MLFCVRLPNKKWSSRSGEILFITLLKLRLDGCRSFPEPVFVSPTVQAQEPIQPGHAAVRAVTQERSSTCCQPFSESVLRRSLQPATPSSQYGRGYATTTHPYRVPIGNSHSTDRIDHVGPQISRACPTGWIVPFGDSANQECREYCGLL